ncbi:hypothetical protein KQX54_018629 [Cotesia glomerata]|uniref:Uncharacterized protein n=1 Tax=Cotesia glomerata TaxID=32391 RepID=A0AAV7I9B5_COTGL|nr:hypothetical protein KQX54_018629 [Cotesia glomerata]
MSSAVSTENSATLEPLECLTSWRPNLGILEALLDMNTGYKAWVHDLMFALELKKRLRNESLGISFQVTVSIGRKSDLGVLEVLSSTDEIMLIKKLMFYAPHVCQIFTFCDCLRQWTSEWLIRPKLDELNPRLITPLRITTYMLYVLCPFMPRSKSSL